MQVVLLTRRAESIFTSQPNYASIPSSDKDIRDHLPAPLRRLAYEKDAYRQRIFSRALLFWIRRHQQITWHILFPGRLVLYYAMKTARRITVDTRGQGDIFGVTSAQATLP